MAYKGVEATAFTMQVSTKLNILKSKLKQVSVH